MAKVTEPIALDKTLQRVAKALEEQRVVKNVDGEGPDANGRINLKAVKKVNGRIPDASGNVNVDIPEDVVRKDVAHNVNLLGGSGVSFTGLQNTAIGSSIEMNGDNSIGIGRCIRVNGSSSFVWSGHNDDGFGGPNEARDHGDGTFNVNPVGGVDGFFIGDTPLSKLGLGGGGSTRDFVFKSFDGFAPSMMLPKGIVISSEYSRLINEEVSGADIEFNSLDKDLYGDWWYEGDMDRPYVDRIVFDMCHIPWGEEYDGGKSYYFIIHGFNGDEKVFSQLIGQWILDGRPRYQTNITIPSYNYETMNDMDIPTSIKGYTVGGLSAYNNIAYRDNISLVASSGIGDPNTLEINKLNICKPVIDPYNPEVIINIPRSTNKLMSREAWLVLDLSNCDYLDSMSYNDPIVNSDNFKIRWPKNVYGGIIFETISENYSDNWQDGSDEYGEYDVQGEINLMASVKRVGIYHLVEVAPDMWIVDTKRLPKYTGLPAGFGSSSGSSSSYDSSNY
jgi:hypothetical protein